jgi:hypothetical protein
MLKEETERLRQEAERAKFEKIRLQEEVTLVVERDMYLLDQKIKLEQKEALR